MDLCKCTYGSLGRWVSVYISCPSCGIKHGKYTILAFFNVCKSPDIEVAIYLLADSWFRESFVFSRLTAPRNLGFGALPEGVSFVNWIFGWGSIGTCSASIKGWKLGLSSRNQAPKS